MSQNKYTRLGREHRRIPRTNHPERGNSGCLRIPRGYFKMPTPQEVYNVCTTSTSTDTGTSSIAPALAPAPAFGWIR
ncbi:hypothetical protein HZH68_000285 [Vespula germanica]|uniref:Uncharacterized protein n=1 Tax=Vespula germanica TaxID=30212 RepID=A0A834U5W6_VESGE|nr:hypothetical protein HZH68_000285 [Vespula germanica]